MSHEILIIDALNIIRKIVWFILLVEIERLINERIVIIVLKMLEFAVEIEN
jgi:hypothetical protein